MAANSGQFYRSINTRRILFSAFTAHKLRLAHSSLEYVFGMHIQNGGVMLQQQKEIVKATVPVLQQHGETITTVFYRTLFDENPSLFNIFNPANQRNGGQARSLAASILTYAAHIDSLGQLGGMVNRIAHKHASLERSEERRVGKERR